MDSLYDIFDEPAQALSLSSARVIVPMALELLAPIKKINSVVDVGCGVGSWLYVFNENGVNDKLGIDGSYIRRETLYKYINPSEFHEADLEQPIDLNRKFDLVNSIEVAEHISEENSKQFIKSLCRLGDIILFSAAIPFQGGVHHVNERFPSYWATLFAQNGYLCWDCLRKRIWIDRSVDCVHRQNIMIYIKKSLADSVSGVDFSTSFNQLDLVHPDLHLILMQRYLLSLKSLTNANE